MISVNSGQLTIASRATAQIVTLVKLDTFSNHAAETIDETFYWASTPILYKWDGTNAVQFKGVLKAVSSVLRGFPHIPNTADLSTRDGFTLDLDASKWADEFPWQRLIAKNLIGAHIQVASLLVDWGDPLPDGWKDQSGLGAVHTVRFRGEVTNVPEYDDEANRFSITCDSIEVPLPWVVALDSSEVSEKDLGKTYPIPVGFSKRVQLVQREVGWITTLSQNLTDETTGTILVGDTTGFPDAPTQILIMIGTELIEAEKSGVNLVILGRGLTAGTIVTDAQYHNAGSVIIEMLDVARFVYSGVENLGIAALYARSPQSGELVRISDGFYGTSTSDKDLDTGIPLGVVSFTPQLWVQLIQLLNNEAKVRLQPAFTQTANLRTEAPPRTAEYTPGLVGADASSDILLTGGGVNIQMTKDNTVAEAGAFYWLTGDVSSQADEVVRFRAVFDYTIENTGNTSNDFFVQGINSFMNFSEMTFHNGAIAANTSSHLRSIVTAWFTPTNGTTMASIVNGGSFSKTAPLIRFVMNDVDAGMGMQVDIARGDFRLEVETVGTIEQTQFTIVDGAQEIGFNIELSADVFGAVTLGDETSHDQMDDSTGWSGTNTTITDVGVPGDGLISTGDGTGTVRQLEITVSPSEDYNGSRMRFDYKIDVATYAMLVESQFAFNVSLTNTGGFTDWHWPKSVLIGDNAWHEFVFDPNGSPTQITALDGVDLTTVIKIIIRWTTKASGDTGSIIFRDLRLEDRVFNTHPMDVAQWLIEENAGITNGVDASSFATSRTNLSGVTVAGDLRQAGLNIGEVLARIGFESRTNFVQSEGPSATVFKAINSLTSFTFTASARTLSEFNSLRTKTKELDEQANEFIGLYDFRNQFDQNDVQGYAALIQTNATTNDTISKISDASITDAQARVGVRAGAPLSFFLVPDLASMIEVFAYYVQESLRGGSLRYTMRVPYSLGYDLEPGDIVEFTPRWASSAIKCRLIQVAFPFDAPGIGLVLEEVL